MHNIRNVRIYYLYLVCSYTHASSIIKCVLYAFVVALFRKNMCNKCVYKCFKIQLNKNLKAKERRGVLLLLKIGRSEQYKHIYMRRRM